MPAHAMTPIREEEVDSSSPAHASTLVREEGPDVNANIAAATKISDDNEEDDVKRSSTATTVIPIHEQQQEPESGIILIGYFFQVPRVKWHPKLEMMSKAGLTQGQYERKVLAQGCVDCSFLIPRRHVRSIYLLSQPHVHIDLIITL